MLHMLKEISGVTTTPSLEKLPFGKIQKVTLLAVANIDFEYKD